MALVTLAGAVEPVGPPSQPPHIDALPNELLAEIFKLDDANHCFGLNSFLPPEVLYSHVSRRWRDITTHLPTLWTRIHIIGGRFSSHPWLPHYLSRSQRCHLHIRLNHKGWDGCYGFEDKITHVMNLLVPHIDRWSTFRVDGCYEHSSYLMLSHLDQLRAPVLRELAVRFEQGMKSMDENSFPSEILQGGAPLLKSIRLDTLLCCRPPVSALTTCTICQSNPVASFACMELIEALASSHALTRLRVNGDVQRQESWQLSRPFRIQLDTLKSLRLHRTFRFTSPLLLAISAPRLETLRLGCVLSSDLEMLFNSPHLSSVEFPALRTLSLDTVSLDNHSYFQLSRVFPSIARLEIRHAYASDFQRLAWLLMVIGNSDAEIIWPKLHTVMVGNFSEEPDNLSTLGDMLRNLLAARREIGSPIERIVLENVLHRAVEELDHLGEYVELWERPYASDDEL